MTDVDVNSKLKPQIKRRDFLKLAKIFGLGIAISAAGVSYVVTNEAGWWEVNQVSLLLPGLPASFSGLRFVQVSDIHFGGWMNLERLKQVFDIVKKLKPGMALMTGDFVLSSSFEHTKASELVGMENELKLVTAKFPTMAVLGNHDHWADARVVSEMLSRGGVRLLVNSIQRVQINNEYLFIAGIDDILAGRHRLDLVLEKIPGKGCAILMAHEPDFADESAATGRFALQLSGHSHGGQVNIPGYGAPVLPELAKKYPIGLYKVGKMYQYTNRGVGMTSPNVRINCRPEITVFTLVSS